MIFLDESGDDGDIRVSTQKFFVVSLILSDMDQVKEEYKKLEKLFKSKKFKWNTLYKNQKLRFKEYADSAEYKVICKYIEKENFLNLDKTYYSMTVDIFENIEFKKEEIIYTGIHLRKMFDKVRRKIKSKNKRFVFREAVSNELFGVLLADLWAGYINYSLKNNLEITKNKNLHLTKTLK